jgi:hypothetical protein
VGSIVVAADDVAPHEHLPALELGQRAQHPDPLEVVVDAVGRQLPRLVEPDVDEAGAREVRQELGEQLPHQRQ